MITVISLGLDNYFDNLRDTIFLSLIIVYVGRLLNHVWIICNLMIKYLNYKKKHVRRLIAVLRVRMN